MPESPPEHDDVRAQDTPDATVESGQTQNQTEDQVKDGQDSESSPEKPAATMLDAVKAAVAPKEASPTSEQGTPEAPKAPTDPKVQPESEDELSQEEFKQLSRKTQSRIKSFERKLTAKDQEISGLKTKADEFDKIETFVRNSGLTNEAVGATLQIAALMRSNPREALARLTPLVGQLQQIVGETLPPELAQRVQQGFLTEDDARALARSSADAALARRQAAEIAAQREVETTQRTQREATDATVGTIETWESNKAKTDPDWNLKRDEIAEQVELAIERENRRRQGLDPRSPAWFPTPEEAVKLSEDALGRVNDRMKRFTPTPRAINPVVPGAASNRNAAAPKTMLDVVKQTVGAA